MFSLYKLKFFYVYSVFVGHAKGTGMCAMCMSTLITDFSVMQVTNISTSQSSVILPLQAKGADEISSEGLEKDSPVVSQPFKRRKSKKINPTVFQTVFEDFATSPYTAEENVSNR
jgi:hypothetical protein